MKVKRWSWNEAGSIDWEGLGGVDGRRWPYYSITKNILQQWRQYFANISPQAERLLTNL
jgi:hypothetical protein